MSKRRRKQNKFPQILYRQIFKLFQAAIRGLIKSLLRSWYRLSRQFRFSQAGFVLPAVTVLLLIMSVVVGSLLFRSFSRTTQVIAEREQQVIYNAATPAIDRAKAKLEYLFQEDSRLPGGLPADDRLESMLLNEGSNGVPRIDENNNIADGFQNPYLLPDETRLDIDGDGDQDNAWSFELDTNGDGEAETVAYSILLRTASGDGSINRTNSDNAKAPELVVRNGPINLISSTASACDDISRSPEAGWDPVNGAVVRRAFQVTALVIGGNEVNRTVATLEMQQDRQADQGNRWGAWFRNDLEIFPGPTFRWNGAIHTEGNLIVGGDSVRAYLISSPASCLYTRDSSAVTIGGNSDGTTPPFLGQMINGTIKDNNYSGNSQFDLHGPNGPSQTFTINSSKDSVNQSNAGSPASLSLDPIVLFTTNENQARSGNPNNAGVRDSDWKNQNVVTAGRILNRSSRAPYVDDTYRADNRYGPKPEYNELINPFFDASGTPTGRRQVGDRITSADPEQGTLTNSNPANVDDLGLDGYWERRAWAEGLRVLVGQRLQLGNAFGWGGASDPLYPPTPNAANGSTMSSRAHELRQWKTLRDNLAAVQSTAVYHHNHQINGQRNRNFPVACLATTAHPGTQTTINNSTTFNRIGSRINTDFLTGNGTNGWEFNPPATSEAAFASAIAASQPLRIALTNLAHFAGDPFGAFPARQDTAASPAVASAGPQVHPYPFLSMWGDFSNLRRVIQRLDGGTNYNDLSIAEKTTLHTASCTLGMLAYNLDTIRSYNSTFYDLGRLIRLNNQLETLSLPSSATPEDYIASLNGSPNDEQETARRLYENEQIERDRRLGFAQTFPYQVQYVDNFQYGNVTYDKDNPPVQLGCDISSLTGNNFFGRGTSWQSSSNKQDFEKGFIRLATSVCSRQAKYPSLFYLFPKVEHFHNGTASSTAIATASGATVAQGSEPYINQPYIFNNSVTNDVNHGYTYKVLQDTNSNGIEDGSENSIGAISIQPRARLAWQLPNTTTTTNRVNIINDNGTNVGIALLDKGMFNGREMMSVRTLDIDLSMLRDCDAYDGVSNDSTVDPSNCSNDSVESWLPDSGIVYAFREDAVREDGVARPRSATWTSCDTASEITNNICLMNSVSASPQDPPVNPNTGISPKPVDFYADPDRRPHGFRLRNGQNLRRNPAPTDADFVLRGLVFVSDNPVYIVGDNRAFNLHNDASSGSRIEEFTRLLENDWGNFYSRGVGNGNGTLNTNFARIGDTWRPAEIIADAISILSEDFVDGSIEEGIRRQNVGDRSSYRTLNAPDNADLRWVRESGSASNTINSSDYPNPIAISRNGFPLYCATNTAGNNFGSNTPNCLKAGGLLTEYGKEASNRKNYINFNNGKDRIDANASDDTRINATIVSGLVPSRPQQSYGGLHNFPRFLENWSGEDLHISGAFVQLNFSSYATGPFDQDSWEPGNAAQNPELIQYYGPPNRRWGYDVGLQYSPAGPVAERFITPSNTRSEFYRELPLDDPYVLNLRCAQVFGDRIDPAVDSAVCPS